MEGFAHIRFLLGFRRTFAAAMLLVSLVSVGVAAPTVEQMAAARFEHVEPASIVGDAEVTSVLQDRNGFVWIGTFASGLFRYDGFELQRYVSDPDDPSTLSGNAVWSLAEDREGNIWVGTFGHGLNRFDPRSGRFERFHHRRDDPESLGNDSILSLLVDSAGTLWVGTYGGGLNRLVVGPDGTHRFLSFRNDPNDPRSIASDTVWALAESAGSLWIGHRYRGLDRVSFADAVAGGPLVAFEHFRHEPGDPSSLSADQVWTLARSSDGSLWVGTDGGGLNRFDVRTGRVTHYPASPDGLASDQVRQVFEDSTGAVWIGHEVAGLQRLDPASGAFLLYPHREGDSTSVSSNRVISFLEDAEGLLWFGTWGGGLSRLDPRTARFGLHVHRGDDPKGLGSGVIWAILEDSAGTVWVGTEKGLNRRTSREGERPVFVREPGILRDAFVTALFEDHNGTIWVGTRDVGLFALPAASRNASATRFVSYAALEGHPLAVVREHVTVLAESRDGILWIGTWNTGLLRWDGQSLTRYRTDKSNPTSIAGDVISTVYEDSTGRIWVGSLGGLNRLDPSHRAFERFDHRADDPGSIGDGDAEDVVEDARGDLWVATYGSGIHRLDRRTGNFTHYGEKEGLASNNVLRILPDLRGRLWLMTTRGLDRFDPADASVVHYDERDGLHTTNFSAGDAKGHFRSRDGRIYLSGMGGYNVFDPNDLDDGAGAPRPLVTRFLLLNKPVPVSESGPIDRDAPFVESIALGHDDYLFGFEYSALTFRRPERVRYAYLLEGFDDHWIEAGADDRKAVYTSLPPGSYTFRVRASTDGRAWVESVRAIRVHVAPPWWKTWWAYLLYVVGVVALVVGGVRFRMRGLERRSADLEALVARRTAEIAESEKRALEAHRQALEASRAKSVFLANMSHELRTPLNAVLGFVQLMERERHRTASDREHLAIIRRSGEHLLGLINDVLSLSKIEAGKITLVERPFDLRRLLADVEAMMRARVKAAGLDLVFDVDPGMPTGVLGDEQKLRQVLINLLGNAVKFTKHGSVTLRARWHGGRARFTVEDTGVGISEAEMGSLFEAFAQTESGRQAKEGTGLGLAISRQIVNLFGGDIAVYSVVGKGTTFSFDALLPLASCTASEPEDRRVVGLVRPEPTPVVWPPRILVADDTPENRTLLIELLGGIGFAVREAANGAEAVEVWRDWRPDLVLMDMRMPVMDGREATRRIRNDECSPIGGMNDEMKTEPGRGRTTSDIHHSSVAGDPRPIHHSTKIVALTASAFEHERDEILSHGADDFVSKPFREKVLLEKLAEHLGVTFRYESSVRAVPAEDSRSSLTVDRLNALPGDLVATLSEALKCGDFDTALGVAEQIRPRDEQLATELTQALQAFQFDELLSLFEKVEGVA